MPESPCSLTGSPAVFMMGSTLVAMILNLRNFAPGGAREDTLLLVVGGILFSLGLWLLVGVAFAIRKKPRDANEEGIEQMSDQA